MMTVQYLGDYGSTVQYLGDNGSTVQYLGDNGHPAAAAGAAVPMDGLGEWSIVREGA